MDYSDYANKMAILYFAHRDDSLRVKQTFDEVKDLIYAASNVGLSFIVVDDYPNGRPHIVNIHQLEFVRPEGI